jgi:hypothetical protein
MFDKRNNLWVDGKYYGKYASKHLINGTSKAKYGAIVSDGYVLTRYGHVGPIQATAWTNSSGHYACDNEFIYRICDY